MPKRYPGVRRLRAGLYEVKGEYQCPKTQRTKTIRRQIEAPNAAAAAVERRRLVDEARSGVSKTTRLQLRNYAPLWLKGKVDALSASTADRYVNELQNHILPAFGDYFLDTITRHDIDEWRTKAAQRFKPSTVNSILRTLKSLIRTAAEDFDFRDPTRLVEGVRETRELEDDEGRVLELDEIARLVNAAWKVAPQWAPLIHTLAVTGLRFSEATALKWKDLDLDQGVLRIQRAQVRGRVDRPKTRGSRRTLPIEPELCSILRQRKVTLKADADDWVFPSATGGLLFSGALTKPMRAAAAEAGLEQVPSAHWLRRSINRLLRQQAQERISKAILGHVTDRMGEHYDHVKTDEKRAAVVSIFASHLKKPDATPDSLPSRSNPRRKKKL